MRQIAAHLLPPAGGFSIGKLAWRVLRFRGNLDRMVDVTKRREAQRPAAELAGDLRRRASTRLSAPVIGAASP
jgi:hypothetical protein